MQFLYLMIAAGVCLAVNPTHAYAQTVQAGGPRAAVQKLYEMTVYQARIDTSEARRLVADLRRQFPDTTTKARLLLADLEAEVAKPEPNSYRVQTLSSEIAWVLDPEPSVPVPPDLDDD
jgi:hypothetical protein